MRRCPIFLLLLLLLLLLLAAVPGAPVAAQDAGAFSGWTLAGLELPVDDGKWVTTRRLVDADRENGLLENSPWARFEAVMGPGWRVSRDAAFRAPAWILGPGRSLGTAPVDADQAREYARDLARKLAGALGIDDLEAMKAMRTSAVPNRHGHTILGVDFMQTLDGYEVRTLTANRRVKFRFDLTLGRLSNLGSEWIPGLEVETDGKMDRDAAVREARRHIPAYVPGTGRVLSVETFVLAGLDEAARARAWLVHEVRFQTDRPQHLWSVILDARSGERLRVADEIRHADVIGHVSLGSLDGAAGGPPAQPFSVKPARDLYVTIPGGGMATTDSHGNFRISHQGTTAVTITGGFAGEWCTVTPGLGQSTTFSRSATPGVAANIVLNPTHTHQYPTAEATAYDWVTRCHYYVDKRIPGFNGLRRLTTNVNQFFLCNGSWSGTAISFTYGGCAGTICCNNTAFSDVIAHEWGHGFHAWFHGKASPASFSEGIADHFALFMTGQRVFGRNIDANAVFTRDYRVGGGANLTQWPAIGSISHKVGEIWAGTMMDMRDYLITKHGLAKGVDIAEAISIPAYARNPSDMPDGIREVMVQDDDDATLLNGTPNFKEIAAAADRHLLPRPPDPRFVQITHAPLTPTRDTVNDYRVTARIISLTGTVRSASLTYWIGASTPVTVPMASTGGHDFTAVIPAQPGVTAIEYQLAAGDTQNHTATLPAGAARFKFHVGREVVALLDDFEKDRGWKPDANDNATTGRFERVDPFYAYHTGRALVCQPEDDHTPGAGTHCYVTQNGPRGKFPGLYDVTGGRTSIISPRFDLSGAAAGRGWLSFAYWFTDWTTPNDVLRLAVSIDDGKSWAEIWNTGVSASAWKEVKDLPIPGKYTSRMRIMIRATDPEFMTICDALIDDVRVRYLDGNTASLRAQTRTPVPGTKLVFAIQAALETRAPFVLAISPNLGPVQLPGLGTMDLGMPVDPIRFGQVDQAGAATFPILIPNHPVLKGQRVHTQALISGKQTIFTNVWTVDIQ